MNITISAYSLEDAFNYLHESIVSEFGVDAGLEDYSSFINLDGQDLTSELIKQLEDWNSDFIFGRTVEDPGENVNQIQTKVENHSVAGDKKWKTTYMAVYDRPNGDQVVPNSSTEIKKDCVDIAREASRLERRDTFVIIGKSPDNFSRLQAEISYKPSPGQSAGLYKFYFKNNKL